MILDGEIMKSTTLIAIVVVAITIVAVGAYAFLAYGYGTLQIKMTDPPSEWGIADQVYVNYSFIEVHRADAGNDSGWFNATSTGGWIDLTQIFDAKQTIGATNLQSGTYNIIRFSIIEATVTVQGTNYTATVPSDKLQITITQGGVAVNAGQTSNLLIELNIKVQGTERSNLRIVPDIRATPT
jgi:hypothetical protein